MAVRSSGRGAVVSIGVLLLLAGVIGGVVLGMLAAREPDRVAEGFARAAPGCTTTLVFSEPGDYYVFEERSSVSAGTDDCRATATPDSDFTFTLLDAVGAEVPLVTDRSVSYDLDVGRATSVARVTIFEAGTYEISVVSDDPALVAAIGGDPDDKVAGLRAGAIAVAVIGVAIGVGLLVVAGTRTRRPSRSPWDGPPDRDGVRVSEQPPPAAGEPAWPSPPNAVRPSPDSPWAPPSFDGTPPDRPDRPGAT